MQIKQQEVLDAVARPVIQEPLPMQVEPVCANKIKIDQEGTCNAMQLWAEDVLNGVNGTIFAYGQTGIFERNRYN